MWLTSYIVKQDVVHLSFRKLFIFKEKNQNLLSYLGYFFNIILFFFCSEKNRSTICPLPLMSLNSKLLSIFCCCGGLTHNANISSTLFKFRVQDNELPPT